jgi:hypothetical protein
MLHTYKGVPVAGKTTGVDGEDIINVPPGWNGSLSVE